ncbi:MAG: 50S ribosomal protein L18e [Nitrososphaerales archaeon]
MLSNPVLNDAIWSFRNAYKKSKAPVWIALQEMLERHRSRRIEVNLSKIAKHTEQGSVVIVPGKVLGSGSINHKVTLCAFSLSQNAAKKIIDSGGKVLSINQFVEKFPEGSKVKIIG